MRARGRRANACTMLGVQTIGATARPTPPVHTKRLFLPPYLCLLSVLGIGRALGRWSPCSSRRDRPGQEGTLSAITAERQERLHQALGTAMADVIDLCDVEDDAPAPRTAGSTRVKLGVRVRPSASDKAVKPHARLTGRRGVRLSLKRLRKSLEEDPCEPNKARRRILLEEEDEEEEEEEDDDAVIVVPAPAAAKTGAAGVGGGRAAAAHDLDLDEDLAIVGGDIGLVRGCTSSACRQASSSACDAWVPACSPYIPPPPRSHSRTCPTPARTVVTMRCPRMTALATLPAALSATATYVTRRPPTARCGAQVSLVQLTPPSPLYHSARGTPTLRALYPHHHEPLQACAGTTTAMRGRSLPIGTL